MIEEANRQFRRQQRLDKLVAITATLFAICLLVTAGLIVYELYVTSIPSLEAFGFKFIINTDWDPVAQKFSALAAIYGTLATAFVALFIAVPISFGIAFFLTELAPHSLRQPFRILIELLAGIPSIIYGMWGLFVLAPLMSEYIQPWMIEVLGTLPIIGFLFQGAPLGISVFTAGVVLSIMIIPFIASVMRDVFEIVPDLLKESAYALGATHWEVVWNVVLPYSKVGVAGGIILGLGRALGETMAVAFVIGNAHDFHTSLMMPGASISSVLANEFTEATGKLYNSSLSELGLILFGITFLVFLVSKYLMRRLVKH
ncbi:MAG: phosphate transporter permease subunit PstC [Gammaproteobacteria bacterium]|nr:phosphate transporter permease subunit PstC [Gammaproteobacteria bacterium]